MLTSGALSLGRLPDAGPITNYFLCRSSDSRVNRPRNIALPVKLHSRLAVRMYSRAEYYRRLGFEAQQRAAQTIEPKIRDMFEDVEEGWFELAKQMDWLDGHYSDQRADKNR